MKNNITNTELHLAIAILEEKVNYLRQKNNHLLKTNLDMMLKNSMMAENLRQMQEE